MIIPVAYIQLRVFNMSAEAVLLMYIVVQILAQIVRLAIVLPMIKMSIKDYVMQIFPRLSITTIVLLLPLLTLNIDVVNLLNLLLYTALMFLYVGLTVFMFITKLHKKK